VKDFEREKANLWSGAHTERIGHDDVRGGEGRSLHRKT
jgi:hypothetical protein